MRNLKTLLASSCLCALTGCMAIGNALGPAEAGYMEPQPLRVYGGTCTDLDMLGRPCQGMFAGLERLFKVVNLVDLPLSLAADTVLLPVVVIRGEWEASDLRSSRTEHVCIGPFPEPADVVLDYRVGRWSGIQGVHWATTTTKHHLEAGEKWETDLAGWLDPVHSRLEIARPSGAVSLSRVERADYGPEQFRKDPRGHQHLWVEATQTHWVPHDPTPPLPAEKRARQIAQSLDMLVKDGLDPDAADAPGDHALAALLKARNNYDADKAVAHLLDLGYPKKNRQEVLDEALKIAPTGDNYYHAAPAYRALVRQGAHMDKRVGQVLKHLAYVAGKYSYATDGEAKAAHEEISWLLRHGALDALKPTPRPSGTVWSDRPIWDLARTLVWDGYEDSALLLLAKPELFDAEDRQELLYQAVRASTFQAADRLVELGASSKKIPWTAAFDMYHSSVAPSKPHVPILHWLKTHGGDMGKAGVKTDRYSFLDKDGAPKQWMELFPLLLRYPEERAALRRLAPTKWDADIDGRNFVWCVDFASIREPEEITFILDWMSARGANLQRKVDGKTLLGCAAKENNTAMIAWLLAHSFDPNEPDDQGKRPMDHDLYPKSKELLEKAGGHPTEGKVK